MSKDNSDEKKKSGSKAGAVIVSVAVVGAAAAGLYFRNNRGDNSEINSQITQSSVSSTANSEIGTTTASQQGENSEPSGGNSEKSNYIELTVSAEKYIYDNHEITFEELLSVLDGLAENTAVVICDENATLKAFDSVEAALKEREIQYEIKK